LETIASFLVDHDHLQPGIYKSRVDGDITTYDIRLCRPNSGQYLSMPAIHTTEHIIATFLRNSSDGSEIIYFGPMGCRTGYYLLVRDISDQRVIELLRSAFDFLSTATGPIPGATAKECGNYREHDLLGAKINAADFLPIIDNWSAADMQYQSQNE
jgi:S-ribosylhomocysteine lyase